MKEKPDFNEINDIDENISVDEDEDDIVKYLCNDEDSSDDSDYVVSCDHSPNYDF